MCRERKVRSTVQGGRCAARMENVGEKVITLAP